MKPQKFSISDILQRDSSVKKTEDIMTLNNADEHILCHAPSLPTPPASPEVGIHDTKSETVQISTESPKRSKPATTKRKRDPIGQILDSLCNNAEKKAAPQTPSAFSPIITSACTSQLSPLTMLANCDRRCYQTSPNLVPGVSYMSSPPSQMNVSPAQLSPDQLQYLHAQRLIALQHYQQQQQHSQQERLAMNQGTNHFLMQTGVQQNPHHLQILREQQAKLLAMEQYHQGILTNQQLAAGKFAQNEGVPLWMAWLKSSADSMTSYPVKESRVPPPPRYQCEDCKKSYSTFGGLSKHKQFHCVSHVKKEFNCKYCDKCYGSLGALKMHIRTHTLPCKCKLCGKAFSRPWLLQGHVRTHTGEKPFKCVHCGRAFADRSNLRAHLQTHSDIKKYGCKNCTKTFSRMSLLLKHEEGSCLGLRR